MSCKIQKSLFITQLQSWSGLETLGSIQCCHGREKSPSFSWLWSYAAQNNILQNLSMATYRGAWNLSSLSFSLFHHIFGKKKPKSGSPKLKSKWRLVNKVKEILCLKKEKKIPYQESVSCNVCLKFYGKNRHGFSKCEMQRKGFSL